MKKRRRIIYIFILTILCAVPCGCGVFSRSQDEAVNREDSFVGDGETNRDASIRAGDEEQNPETDIEMEIWTFFDMNTPGDYYLTLWDELAAKHGYKLKVGSFSTEQIKDKLEIALECRELPDIFLVWGGTYPDYLFDAGACIPLQDYIEASQIEYLEDYIQPYRDGNNYIVPCLVEAYAVTYYNKELIEKMDLTIPQTWEELLEMAEQVQIYNDKNGTDYAAVNLGNKDSWLGELLYCMIVNRIDPNAFDRLAAGEIDFSDEIFVQAADDIMELRNAGAFSRYFAETGEVEAVENFIQGEAVLFPHQSTIMYYLIQNMGEDAIGMTQFVSCNPAYDGTYMQYLMDINHTLTPGLCVSSSTEYPDEAAELCLEFSKAVNEINVTEYGYVNYTAENLPLPEELPEVVEQFHDMLEQKEKVTPYWYALLERKDANGWRYLTKQLLDGKIEINTFIQMGKEYLKFP